MNAAARAEPSSSSVAHQHRGRARVRLDVVGLVAEPLEADEVVRGLPDDAGHRHLGHHPEHDDLRARSLGRRATSPGISDLAPADVADDGRAVRRCRAASAPGSGIVQLAVDRPTLSSSSCVPRSTIRPSLEDEDLIGVADRREAVGDHEGRAALHQLGRARRGSPPRSSSRSTRSARRGSGSARP